jgi:hypothetical protein
VRNHRKYEVYRYGVSKIGLASVVNRQHRHVKTWELAKLRFRPFEPGVNAFIETASRIGAAKASAVVRKRTAISNRAGGA